MRTLLLASMAVIVSTACGTAAPAPAAAPSPLSSPSSSLSFVEDDYARALADGRAVHRLVFVDAWAPWCHTCLSMRAFTFRDPKVLAHAAEYTWASIDTEKPENAAWVAAHPMHSWPTLYVVDPTNDTTVLTWANSATADELVALLAGASAAAAKGAPIALSGPAANLEAELDALAGKKEYAGCAAAAERELPGIPRGAGRATTFALGCALQLAADAREPMLGHLVERARKTVANPDEPILADDRSDLYEAIVEALNEEKRTDDAHTVATQWAAYLDAQASRAPDAATRAVFDAHRLGAYLALGSPERAIPMLEQSARDFPNDYNPPARLALAYAAMKRYDDALTALGRALPLVYGGRMLRLYALEADVLEAKGDRAGAAAALHVGVARARATPLSARYAAGADELEKRARTLESK
jgi:tetratricopeptide (TPR) repeat protein